MNHAFFGFKLHLVFNHQRQIVALKLTPGNVNDTTPVPDLTRDLMGKLFGDKGYVGQDATHHRSGGNQAARQRDRLRLAGQNA